MSCTLLVALVPPGAKHRYWAGGLAVAGLLLSQPALGQDLFKDAKERARQQATGRAHRAAAEAVDSAASAIEKTARCLISDAQCIKAAQEAGQPVLVTGPDGRPVSPEDSAAAVAAAGAAAGAATVPVEGAPSEGAPGESPTAAPAAPAAIATADFAADALGAPPGSVTVQEGVLTVEAHEIEGGRWLTGKERPGGSFYLPLPAKLPASFTLTFDFIGRSGMIWVRPSGALDGAHAMVETSGLGLLNDGTSGTDARPSTNREDGIVHHARLVGRDSTMSLYIDDTPVAEATSARLARRGARIAFGLSVYGAPVAIGAIAVTEGAQ